MIEGKRQFQKAPRVVSFKPFKSAFLHKPAIVLYLLALSTIFTSSYGNSLTMPPGVTATHPVRYRVKMRTKVVVPTSGPHCTQIRVWHALPTTRPWSRVTRIPGVLSLSYLPKTAKLELEKDQISGHTYFEDNTAFQPGQVAYYQSEFEVYSAERNFDPGSRAVTWRQYSMKDLIGSKIAKNIDPEIAQLADQLRAHTNPVSFVVEACKWIRENIKYDAGVPYAGEDASSIMKFKRGHCGHAQTIFWQMCGRVGIPYKPMFGLDLYSQNGVNELSDVRKDYANAHTWGEVYFPNIGWVEVDTFEGEKCFTIDRRFIQNNTAFENYAIWVKEVGVGTREVRWTTTGDGKYVCDYGVENQITFSQNDY